MQSASCFRTSSTTDVAGLCPRGRTETIASVSLPAQDLFAESALSSSSGPTWTRVETRTSRVKRCSCSMQPGRHSSDVQGQVCR